MFTIILAVFLTGFDDKKLPSSIRYLSVSEDKEEYLKASSFVLNSLSRKSYITRPTMKGKKLIRFDLKDYGIPEKAYDSIPNHYGNNTLIMPADYFINEALKGPYYHKLLNILDLKSFNELVYAKEIKNKNAFILSNSKVTRSLCKIYRQSTLSGALWIVEDLGESKIRQMIGNLPNGLQVYYATNKNKPINNMDVKFWVDMTFDDNIVQVARNCITCHQNGIEAFKTKSLHFKQDQDRYAESLKMVNGLSPSENAQLITKIVKKYNDSLFFPQAMKELGINTKEEFVRRVKKTNNPQLLHLIVEPNCKIPRQVWESLFNTMKE